MSRSRRPSIKRLALIACALLIAAFAVIAAAVHFLDPRPLAASLAASVKADTGRELHFGNVEVRLLPLPAFVLSDVRFANADWGSQPWLAQIAEVSADIDPYALLSGRLRIRHIAAAETKVFLETDANGNGNWSLGPAQPGAPAWLRALQIDELALRSLTLSFRDGASGKLSSVKIDAARMVAASTSHPIRFTARGSFDGRAGEMKGTIGALAELTANAPAYPVDLEGRIGTASVNVRGTIDQPWDLAGCSLALSAQTPEFAEVTSLLGATLAPLGPFRGAARLTGAVATPVFSDIDIELGSSERMRLTARGEVTGRLSAGGVYDWQGIGVDLLLQGVQFGDLAPWYGKSLPALGHYRIAARMAGRASAPELSEVEATFGGHGMPEIRLHGAVANLRTGGGMDLRLAAAANEWWHAGTSAGGTRLPPFRASARLRDSRHGYQVDDLAVKVGDSTVLASLQVARAGSQLRISGKASSPLIDLAKLPREPAAAKGAPAAAAKPHGAEHWKLVNADLDLKVGRLVFADGRELVAASGRLALEHGRLKASALQARLGGASVRLEGTMDDPQNLAGMDLRVAVQGDELAELIRFFGRSIAPVGAYQGQAQLRGSIDALRLMAIEASAGRPGQRLRAAGQIDDARNWQGVQLAITANVSDSTAAGRLFGVDLPRLPALRATARVTGPQGGYTFDDLKLALGRTSMQGRIAYTPGEPRPRVTATLSGPLVDLSELPSAQSKAGAPNPLSAADVDANIRFARVVLPDRRALGAVSGSARLVAGSVELKQFTIAMDGASVTLDGAISDPLKWSGLDLMVNAAVTRSAGLTAFTGLRLQNLPAFTGSGRLTDVPNGFALADVKLASAAAAFAGSVNVTRGSKRYRVSAKGTSPLLDVSAFIASPAGNAKKPPATGRAIPDLPLPLDFLRAIDADLDLRFDAVKFGESMEPLGPLLVRATIADAVLKAEHLQVGRQPGQTLSMSGTVDAAQSAWTVRAEGTGIDFGRMLARFGRPNLVTGGSTDLALQLQGRGNSLPAVLATLNGEVHMKVGPHQINHFAIDIAGGLVARAFSLANPFRKTDPNTEVKCLAARLPVQNGVFTSDRRFAVETAKYNLVMSGSVNLRTEAIDIAVTPVVTHGLASGEVSTIVRVRGTLAAPTAGVDKVSALMSAASVGAAIAFPGIGSIADAVIRKAMSDPNPCATALAQ